MSLLDEMRARLGASADELRALGTGTPVPDMRTSTSIVELAHKYRAFAERCLDACASLPVEAMRPVDLMHLSTRAIKAASDLLDLDARLRAASPPEAPRTEMTRDELRAACLRALGPAVLN